MGVVQLCFDEKRLFLVRGTSGLHQHQQAGGLLHAMETLYDCEGPQRPAGDDSLKRFGAGPSDARGWGDRHTLSLTDVSPAAETERLQRGGAARPAGREISSSLREPLELPGYVRKRQSVSSESRGISASLECSFFGGGPAQEPRTPVAICSFAVRGASSSAKTAGPGPTV